jgi:hypothetical protein
VAPTRYCLLFGTILITAACAPRITAINPTYGPDGTVVTVTGERLVEGGQPANTAAYLGTMPQPIQSATASTVTFRVAPGALTNPVRITTPRGAAISPQVFEVVDDASDPQGPFTFGGTGPVQAANVTPTGVNQPVLMGILRAKWSPNTGNFATFMPDGDAAFTRMNDFWAEGTFGLASFQKQYVATTILDLPKSMDFYYHTFRQREITSRGLPASVTFPVDQTLTIASDGQDIAVTFAAGTLTLDAVKAQVDAAIAAAVATAPPPTFTFMRFGAALAVRTTQPVPKKAKLELSGTAIPTLGFGTAALYNLGGTEAVRTMFGVPITSAAITFPAAQNLVITTRGATTTVNFAAGTVTMADVIAAIQAAFPGPAQQQPFMVQDVADPTDATKSFLQFRTDVAADGDHGYVLTVAGTALQTLGLTTPGLVQRYEAETFRGEQAIDDGFTVHANSLPAGTDLTTVFGNASMFVGLMVDDNQFRAHFNTGTFDINGANFGVSWFVGRQSDAPGPVFTHETGHALGLPDLYRNDQIQMGTPPGSWDVMDCSRCDAHATGWLKSRHHRTDATGAWIDSSRVAVLGPPSGGLTSTWTYILTPVESPFISANPFATAHPGVEVVHGIELISTDPGDVVFVENRQKGVYRADHLGLAVDFSTQIPSEGVIMYQGRRLPTQGLASFLPVNLITPMANPLNTLNEEREHVITNMNRIKIKVLERLANPDMTAGTPSFSYKVEVTWGEGSFYDLSITPWPAPPYESVDIWIDNQAENGWGVYTYNDGNGNPIQNGDNVAVNQDNRLYARIRNLGDVPVTQDFQVIWRIAVPAVAGGEVVTELGRVTVTDDIPGEDSIVTPFLVWRPTSSNDKHVCIKAEIVTVPGELNGTANNSAQENFTQWFSPGSSPFAPVTLTIATQNPWPDRDADVELHVPNVPRGWTVTVENGRFRLGPGATRQQTITIRAYAAEFAQIIRKIGYIPERIIDVQARTPVGDMWVPYGGLTVVVHPVNQDSRIGLDPPRTSGTTVTFTGRLVSTGQLTPPLGGRDVHVRLQAQNGTITWITTATTAGGTFQITLPPHLLPQTLRVRAFTPGGRGFAPAVSNEIVRTGTPGTPGVPGVPAGGVVATLAADGRLSTFVGLLHRSGLASALEQREGGFTLFAPTDAALKASGQPGESDKSAAQRLVQAHVAPGILTRWDLKTRDSLRRLSGAPLRVTSERQVIQIGNARILGEPIHVPGGVVYPVEGLFAQQ